MKFASIETKQLIIDRRYQRELDQRRVEKIVDGFDPRLLGTLEVSRHNGKCAVFDGQHRLAALRGIGIEEAPCIVHDDLTPQQEADLFVALQRERRNINPLERFRARVFAGDKTARALKKVVESVGYKIGNVPGIRAVTTLERIYSKHGAAHLVATLELLKVWDGDDKATNGHLIEGVSILLSQYGDRVDAPARAKLADVAPGTIIRRATGKAAGGGAWTAHAVAAELRQITGVRGRPTVFRGKKS